MKTPTPSQIKAIKLAKPSRHLRRLPGGYWVGDETPWRGAGDVLRVPPEQYVGTQTVMACHTRGWFEVEGFTARLTDAGFAFISQ